MNSDRCTFIFLPGAGGGGEHDIAAFAAELGDPFHFKVLSYPGWQRYVARDFSADVFVEELTARIVEETSHGPIRIIGCSIGGHLAYAAALRLQHMGREVACLCAIDSFMIQTARPSSGWQSRAALEGLEVLKQGGLKDIAIFARSKFWRALVRLAGGRLSGVLRRFSCSRWLASALALDKVAEQELSMRLLLREMAPWLASLDRQVRPASIPALLLRTRLTASDDEAWRRRCSNVVISEVPGEHLTLFQPENIAPLSRAFSAALLQ